MANTLWTVANVDPPYTRMDSIATFASLRVRQAVERFNRIHGLRIIDWFLVFLSCCIPGLNRAISDLAALECHLTCILFDRFNDEATPPISTKMIGVDRFRDFLLREKQPRSELWSALSLSLSLCLLASFSNRSWLECVRRRVGSV